MPVGMDGAADPSRAGGDVPGGRRTVPEESGAEGQGEQAGIGPGRQGAESLACSRDTFDM